VLETLQIVGKNYMPSAAPCYQWKSEFTKLLRIYRARKPERMLEIGTYHGGTLYHWLQNAEPGTIIVSLDSYLVGVDNRAAYDEWVPDDVTLHVLEGDSRKQRTIAEVRTHAPFDWLFIDAGHYYEEVRDDWENYRPMVAPGGIIVFHDILPPSRTWPDIQVAWLWKEIKAFGWSTREIIAYPDAEWGGIGLVML